jgi:hypothetical protein
MVLARRCRTEILFHYKLIFAIFYCLLGFFVKLIVSPAIVPLTVPQATPEQTVPILSPSHQVLLHFLQHEACCLYKSLNKVSCRSCTPKRAPRICKRRIIPERLFPQWYHSDKNYTRKGCFGILLWESHLSRLSWTLQTTC